MFKDDDQDRTGWRSSLARTPHELIVRLAEMTAFIDPDVVLSLYRRIRLLSAIQNGKTHAARLLNCHVRSIYKFMAVDIGNAITNVNRNYREILLSGFPPGKPFRFSEAYDYLVSQKARLSEERLRGLLKQCELDSLVTTEGKDHEKAIYTATDRPIVGDYSTARLKASLTLGADDFEMVSIKLKLGPNGLKLMHDWLDSTSADYPIYDLMYGLDQDSEGAKDLVRVSVISVLYDDKPCSLASHRKAPLITAVDGYEETFGTFIRPTLGDFTPANARKLWSRIKTLKKEHFARLAAAAMLKDEEGHGDYVLSIARGTL